MAQKVGTHQRFVFSVHRVTNDLRKLQLRIQSIVIAHF